MGSPFCGTRLYIKAELDKVRQDLRILERATVAEAMRGDFENLMADKKRYETVLQAILVTVEAARGEWYAERGEMELCALVAEARLDAADAREELRKLNSRAKRQRTDGQ